MSPIYTLKIISVTVLFIGISSCAMRRPADADTSLESQTLISGSAIDLTKFKNPGGITEAEIYAASLFTSSELSDDGETPYYKRMNNALREQNKAEIRRFAKLIKDLASLANKSRRPCNRSNSKFYRFIDDEKGVLINQLKTPGQTFVERGFYSATEDEHPDDEGKFSGRRYVIVGTASNCPSIKEYSTYEGENEILFPPGTEFIVTAPMRGNRLYVRVKEK